MSVAYPIITIHKGDSDYLWKCLHQAHYSNPRSRIVLLGDDANARVPDFIEHYRISNYFDGAREFAPLYRHFSPNPYDFELFCIQRWFVLREFMQKARLPNALHVDSDVLIYSDFSREQEYMRFIASLDFNISETSGHTSFFNSLAILDRFCAFATNFFSDHERLEKVAQAYRTGSDFKHVMKYKGGSLQDMALLTSFSQCRDVRCADTTITRFGTNINLVLEYPRTPDFCNAGQMINVVFRDRIPYGVERATGALVRFHTLHFQGWAKRLMAAYATFDKDASWTAPVIGFEEFEVIYGYSLGDQFRELPGRLASLSRKVRRKIRRIVGTMVRRGLS